MKGRYFIYASTFDIKNPESHFDSNRPALLSRKCCSIMDRETIDPITKRYVVIESGLAYLDAYPKVQEMNRETAIHDVPAN